MLEAFSVYGDLDESWMPSRSVGINMHIILTTYKMISLSSNPNHLFNIQHVPLWCPHYCWSHSTCKPKARFLTSAQKNARKENGISSAKNTGETVGLWAHMSAFMALVTVLIFTYYNYHHGRNRRRMVFCIFSGRTLCSEMRE